VTIDERCALAVIIGRAGSKGLPGKNSRVIAGQPMICHTIDDALSARCVQRVVVSTDGEAIAAAAEAMGIEVVPRPAELASDTATVDSAVRHAVEISRARHPIIVILYANVPVRPDDLIDRAVEKLIDTGADSVQSYSDVGKHHPHWMVKIDDDDRVKAYESSTAYRRQDLPTLFIPDGGVIAVTRTSLFRAIEGQPHAFLGKDRRGIISSDGAARNRHAAAVIDIDTPIDFVLAEALLQSRRPLRAGELL
jgi:CMP-N,N'-diacetyllegionaminic acid synthase